MRKTAERFVAYITNPTVQVRWWGIMTVIWTILMPIELVTGLRTSVEWIVFMSAFANAASCGTAWVAAMSYFRARRVDEANLHAKLDQVIDNHGELDQKVRAIMGHHGISDEKD